MQATEVDTFDVLARLVRDSFRSALAWGDGKLYTTDAGDIFPAFLDGFSDPAERQHHNCSCCRSFLNRYGSLAVINAAGEVRPAMWAFIDPVQIPRDMFGSASAVALGTIGKKITGVFLSSEPEWGTAQTGHWRHFSVTPPAASVYKRGVLTAGQRMAEHRQEFGMLRRGLDEYSTATFTQAVAVLQTETLYRGDKFAGVAAALLDLKMTTEATTNQRARDSLLWRAVATQPAGFAHIRSSMIGTLLDDIQAGKPLEAVKRAFDAKMHPLAYQRPTAAPTAGNIDRAEKLVESLGLRPSLERRYASVDEVLPRAVWTPSAAAGPLATPDRPASPAGAFAGLRAQAGPVGASALGAIPITWAKFCAGLMQAASAIELLPPVGPASYGAITAATNPEAPPLFAWDDPAVRNPFGWYRWTGVDAPEFGLTVGAPVRVSAIVPVPSGWFGPSPHEGAILLLDGAADMNTRLVGLGIFPELVRGELREVRSTINAHSTTGMLGAAPGVQAAGLVVRKGVPINATLRVTVRGAAVDYAIGKWD